MKCIYVNPKEVIKAVDIEPELQTYYRMLNCRTIDIVERVVCGEIVDVICDDEGLLIDEPIPSAINSQNEVMLVGNLILCSHDDEGNEVALSDEVINKILKDSPVAAVTGRGVIQLLSGVEYPVYQ